MGGESSTSPVVEMRAPRTGEPLRLRLPRDEPTILEARHRRRFVVDRVAWRRGSDHLPEERRRRRSAGRRCQKTRIVRLPRDQARHRLRAPARRAWLFARVLTRRALESRGSRPSTKSSPTAPGAVSWIGPGQLARRDESPHAAGPGPRVLLARRSHRDRVHERSERRIEAREDAVTLRSPPTTNPSGTSSMKALLMRGPSSITGVALGMNRGRGAGEADFSVASPRFASAARAVRAGATDNVAVIQSVAASGSRLGWTDFP